MSAARQMITLRGTGGVSLDLPAIWLKEGLAVTLAWGRKGYSLSHIRTGVQVAWFGSKGSAVLCARALLPLARWTTEKPLAEITADQRTEIGVQIAAFDGEVRR